MDRFAGQERSAYEHHLTEALWVHQWHNVVDEDLLKRMLRSPDYHARAAATHVLCYWRDRVKDALALLKIQAEDESPRVRLEASALAASSNHQAPRSPSKSSTKRKTRTSPTTTSSTASTRL